MKCLFIALSSLLVGWVIDNAYSVGGWENYSSLALVDLFFMYIFGAIDIELIRKRWISCLLFITVCASLLISLLLYIYQYYDLTLVQSITQDAVYLHTTLSLIVSTLILLVAVIPKRILRVFDGRFWPVCLNDVYSCNIHSREKAIKEIASRCR